MSVPEPKYTNPLDWATALRFPVAPAPGAVAVLVGGGGGGAPVAAP